MSLLFHRRHHLTAAVAMLVALGACRAKVDRSPVIVDVIGTSEQMHEPMENGGNAAGQTMLAATAQGLVAFDAGGDLIGGLAERWIVDDNGQSYLFRLKRARWANGDPVKAQDVARLLRARFEANPALLAGLDPQVRGMTDEVLEIRLPGPMPSFLQLLAHPAIAIARRGVGTGPFRGRRNEDMIALTPLPLDDSADAAEDGDDDAGDAAAARRLFLRPVRAASGFVRFQREYSDLLLGGRFQHLPYVAAANPARTMVRADPVNGLLGLIVEGGSDFLADPDNRTVLSSAIDRGRLSQQLNLAGWRTATTILPAKLDLGRDPMQPSWTEAVPDIRQQYNRSVIRRWADAHDGKAPLLRIALPAGPGTRILLHSLRRDFAAIGVTVELVDRDAPADLRLIDEVAPFDSAIWYLARIGCGPNRMCDKDAEAALDRARKATTDQERAAALQDAETLSLAEANYIPIGMPVRFSLVRPRLTGYLPSPRARHPLNALFLAPK